MFIDMESSRQGKVFVAVIGRCGGRVKVLQKLVLFLGKGFQALPLGFTVFQTGVYAGSVAQFLDTWLEGWYFLL